MMDSSFVMQRYWGSDDSDEDSVPSIPVEKADKTENVKRSKAKQIDSTTVLETKSKEKSELLERSVKKKKSKGTVKETILVSSGHETAQFENDIKNKLQYLVPSEPEISATTKKKRKRTFDSVTSKDDVIKREQNSSLTINEEKSVNEPQSLTPPKKKRKKEKRDSVVSREEEFKKETDNNLTEQDEKTENEVKSLPLPKKKRKKEKSGSFVLKEDKMDEETGILPSTKQDDKTEIGVESLRLPKKERKKKKSGTIMPEEKVTEPNTSMLCQENEEKLQNRKATSEEEGDDQLDSDTVFAVIGEVKKRDNEKLQRELPEWLAQPSVVSINLNDQQQPIAEIPYLDDIFKNNLISQGFKFLFPVQRALIPWLIECDRRRSLVHPPDVCVSAPTGSGKTLAYALPIVHSLRNRMVCMTRALIVLPVTDLAAQVFSVFESLCTGTDLKTVLLTRTKPFQEQRASLTKHGERQTLCLADIVVCTSGALVDQLQKTPEFGLQNLRYLVIDEADRMFKTIQEGFLKEVERAVFGNTSVADCCPQDTYRRNKRPPSTACALRQVWDPLQKVLCSATLSQDPETLHTLSLYRPKLFCAEGTVGTSVALPDCLDELCVLCDSTAKPMVIKYLVQLREFKRVLCFTEEVERAHRLFLVLNGMGDLKVREVSSGTSARQREKATSDLVAGHFDVLVSSDMFARGMDIEGVDCVISYDDPHLAKTYIHRCGRTARAGQPGTSIILLTYDECNRFKRKMKGIGKRLPQCITVSTDELTPYVKSFQSALQETNATIEREKVMKLKKVPYQLNQTKPSKSALAFNSAVRNY